MATIDLYRELDEERCKGCGGSIAWEPVYGPLGYCSAACEAEGETPMPTAQPSFTLESIIVWGSMGLFVLYIAGHVAWAVLR